MEKNSPYKPAFGVSPVTLAILKKLFLDTLSSARNFQNKHAAAIIHGKNAPRFVQYTASTTGYGDPIVLDIKKKMCECTYAVCVCWNTHFISDRIKNQVKEDGLEE